MVYHIGHVNGYLNYKLKFINHHYGVVILKKLVMLNNLNQQLIWMVKSEEDDEVSRRYYNPKLEQRYYKNGVRPEWLCVHRILNHRKEKGIPMYYLVKWRELGYEQATWEVEKNGEFTDMIENWQQHIDNYWKLR